MLYLAYRRRKILNMGVGGGGGGGGGGGRGKQGLEYWGNGTNRGGGGWFGCFEFNGPLRQYFSLYRAVSQRVGIRGETG